MPAHQISEPPLAPELEAIAIAADQRLRAEVDGSEQDLSDRQQAVMQAASTAIAAGISLGAVADAEQIGQARARRELGSELLRRVERTARRSREAQAEYEQTVARAARLGLPHRDIAAAAQIAHGTIRAIITRVSDITTQPTSNAAAEAHHEPEQHDDSNPPRPDAAQH